MKLPVIDLEVLAEDIRFWGVPAVIHYDENEEAYVIHAGEIDYGVHKGEPEIIIAPGFKYRHGDGGERILGEPGNLHINVTEDSKVNSAMRSKIIAQSRMNHHCIQKQEFVTC